MLNGTALRQITEGRPALANRGAEGSFETISSTFDIDGIGFVVDPDSPSILRDMPPPSRVPTPPALVALLIGVLSPRSLTRRKRRRIVSVADVSGGRPVPAPG